MAKFVINYVTGNPRKGIVLPGKKRIDKLFAPFIHTDLDYVLTVVDGETRHQVLGTKALGDYHIYFDIDSMGLSEGTYPGDINQAPLGTFVEAPAGTFISPTQARINYGEVIVSAGL